MSIRYWAIGLILTAVVGCNNTGGSSVYKTGWVTFRDIKGSLPAGCAQDFQVAGGSIGIGQTQGGSVLNILLSEQPLDSDTTDHSFVLILGGVSKVFAGQVFAFVPSTAIFYSCFLTTPQSSWTVKDGQLTIDSVSGNQATYHLSVQMVPGNFNSSTATFSLYFEGTTPLFQ